MKGRRWLFGCVVAASMACAACSDPAANSTSGAGANGEPSKFGAGGLADGAASQGAVGKGQELDGQSLDMPAIGIGDQSDVASPAGADGPPASIGDQAAMVDTIGSDPGATGPDGGFLPDGTLTGGVGSPCSDPMDCDSGQCVESKDGKICAKLCANSCNDGFTCAALKSGSADLIYVCVPTYSRLCDPCGKAADCNPPGVSGGVCLPTGPTGDDGSFCAMKCEPGETDPCPVGFGCKAALGGFACQPAAKKCTCRPSAAAKELSTSCASQNALGVCLGSRTCKGGTLTDCSAAVAATELCNGADDDCNGKIDDVGSVPCENKNEFGVCSGTTKGCAAAGPLCTAAQPKPETCNQMDDDCDGITDENLCEDGNVCTAGSCNPDGTCKQSPTSADCDDGSVCTGKDQCVQGLCQGSAAKACDDANPCTTDLCDPKTGCSTKAADPGVACADDGNPCTADQCAAGKCEHPSVAPGTACQDDGNPCTEDACQGVSCVHSPAKLGTACADDGDPCTGDTCDGSGGCSHPIGKGICKIANNCVASNAINPSNPCELCDPSSSQVAYVPKDGLACSDSNLCTIGDVCKAGKCNGVAKSCTALDADCALGSCSLTTGTCIATPKAAATACNDGNGCTSADVCNGSGSCAGKAVDCSALSDGCNTGVCSGNGCVKQQKATNTACNDNNACTATDVCTAGLCKGSPVNCSSKTDVCNDGICSNGICAAKAKPDNTLCSDGNVCTLSDVCKTGICTGTSTADSSEPNNVSPGKTLIDKSDCAALSQLSATLSPIGDVDWYFFNSKDDTFCTVKPQAKIENLAADYDLCVYFECANGTKGTDTVSCAQGTKVSGGPNSSFGCCSTNGVTTNEFAKVSPKCSLLGTGNDGGKTWVKVLAKSGATCGGYTLYWGAKD